jgi:hypothetical protein
MADNRSRLQASCLAAMLLACAPALAGPVTKDSPYVRVSPRDPRYFELSDGTPWLPIGLNMIAGGDKWMEQLAANRGNYIRIWLSTPTFDVEHKKSGVFDEAKAKRIDALFATARRLGIRLKLCLEHFRTLEGGRQPWAQKPLHLVANGGTASSIADFFDGKPSRDHFRKKLDWYAKRYGSDPVVFGWELWNEVNAVRGGDVLAWSEAMLPELHRRFPKNLAMQSLGSYDSDWCRKHYERLAVMPGNDVAQVHRYLDLGARYKICGGPVDVLAVDAVRILLKQDPKRPVILAESGAVEPRHTGPFTLYAKDKKGIILHDVLFAPFFAGAAGPGHCWHWDRYVAKNDLWWHFARFAAAVDGIDPPAEGFRAIAPGHPSLRVLALRGKRTFVAWLRDPENTWKAELAEGKTPRKVEGATLALPDGVKAGAGATVRTYDPWSDAWNPAKVAENTVALPAFSRSIVVRIDHGR